MRYRKNIKGGEKKIIDQKAILKTGKTTAVPIMRLQLRSTVKPDR